MLCVCICVWVGGSGGGGGDLIFIDKETEDLRNRWFLENFHHLKLK